MRAAPRGRRPAAWRVEWREGWDEVWEPNFLTTWERLRALDPYATVFHTPALARAWAETLGAHAGARPLVGLARDGDGREVLVPWVAVDYGGRYVRRRQAEAMGGSYFCYQYALASGPDADWAGLWDAVRRGLGPRCDQTLVRFGHPAQVRGEYGEPCGEASPVLELDGAADVQAVLRRCSANHRGDVRRRLRRLHEAGDVQLWVAGPADAARAAADFRERFVSAHARLWAARPAGDQFARPATADFIERAICEGVPAGWLHYSALHLDGEPVAWQIGLVEPGHYHYWIPTYDPDAAALAPSKVLLALLVQHAIERGATRFHFLTGAHPYKAAWNPAPGALRSLRWHSPTLRGRLLSLYDRARHPAAPSTPAPGTDDQHV